jgi:glycosyltransferase involved in cell wall biosynthesis
VKICFVCNEYPPGPHGGIGTLAQTLARGFAASGHQVRVIGLYGADYSGADHELDEGVQVWRYREPSYRGGWIVGRRRLFATIAEWCRTGQVDFVEFPDWQGMAAGWPSLPVPVIARLNGSATYFAAEMGRPARRLTRMLERAALKRADFVCSVSRYTADRTRDVFKFRRNADAVLLNPVPLHSVPPPTARSKHDVVFSGTLTAKKGVVSLIDAWPLVRERCAGARLHLLGKDGTAENRTSMKRFLESRLRPADRNSVTFHGHVDRATLFGHLRRARAAVFPSFAEAFAIAPLEAMGCGCPTVASVRGAGPEAIQSGHDGILVDPASPAEIAAAVASILLDDDLAARLGDAGERCVADRFSLDRLLPQNIAFYEHCFAQFHGTARDAVSAVA